MDQSGRVRFGLFDFDPVANELRRDGVLIRLQAQPAQVLALLIRHAGEVVSRDTLRQAVWGAETFVDFDRGLNFCVAQIRSVLGDSAESPRFIRTIPKRGYQFIAPVGLVQAALVPAPETVEPPTRRRLAGGLLGAVSLGAVSLGALGLWGWTSRPGYLPERVAVARFDNQTGQPDFDRLAESLTDSVVVELAAAGQGQFEVIGNAAILREPRTRRNLLAMGSSLKAGYIVLGQVQGDTANIRVLIHLIALPEQTHIHVVRAELAAAGALKAQAGMARRVATEFQPLLAARRRKPVSRR